MTIIRINNCELYAYHGVFPYEKEHGNKFEIDIEMHCSISGHNDDISRTVNYKSVYDKVKAEFTSVKYNLIETACDKIGASVLNSFPLVQAVTISIRKPNAPLGIIDSVEVEQTYTR